MSNSKEQAYERTNNAVNQCLDEVDRQRTTIKQRDATIAVLRGDRDDYRGRCNTYRAALVATKRQAAALRVALWQATGLPIDWTDQSHIDEARKIQEARDE